ncbi:hypothetical protein DTO169E5_5013 [Paecilomyces variotii]|nr:hypothetical protein DTO169E5_5013 [Paecilomyces variotii]KAJ9389039.1 hypothetical protein DTO063F5_2199 [Paecilomyces variotii]
MDKIDKMDHVQCAAPAWQLSSTNHDDAAEHLQQRLPLSLSRHRIHHPGLPARSDCHPHRLIAIQVMQTKLRSYSLHSRDGPTIFSFQQKLLMDDSGVPQRRRSEPAVEGSLASEDPFDSPTPEALEQEPLAVPSDALSSVPPSPGALSRNPSFSNSSSYQEDWDTFPPLDKLTVFDILDNLALHQKLERWQQTLTAQRERVRKQRERLKSTSLQARDRVVGEWKRRVPTADEQLDKYRRRMRESVDRLGAQWNKTSTVTLREKLFFIAGILNIFISGYLIGAYPEYLYLWYSGQLAYFMPIRFYTYRKRGYHYFLADLCYFVNMMCMLSFFVFPNSKRLFISTYCLAYGNNAVAIAMWRNSMVFHSMDKVVSVFIHIMPPAALHCLTHLTAPEILKERFPAIYAIKYSDPASPEHYSLGDMVIWATVPYLVWQLSYHFLITVRHREQIAAGRPTSFTWLRKSYAKTWIGKIVLSLPEVLQEPAFMLIQYFYAILTMIPCPIWFWYKWASSAFLSVVFIWSIYNGATYYIDVFGKRFQKELEQLRRDVAKWQASPEGTTSPILTPDGVQTTGAQLLDDTNKHSERGTSGSSIDSIPLLDAKPIVSGVEDSPPNAVRPRN